MHQSSHESGLRSARWVWGYTIMSHEMHFWPMLAHELPLLQVWLHLGQQNSPNTRSGPW